MPFKGVHVRAGRDAAGPQPLPAVLHARLEVHDPADFPDRGRAPGRKHPPSRGGAVSTFDADPAARLQHRGERVVQLTGDRRKLSGEPLVTETLDGREGGLGVEDPSVDLELVSRFVEAGTQAGLPLNPDFNGASQEGVGRFQLTTRKGRRSSSARAFLGPAMRRPNLRVVTHAHVTRILFEGRLAVGVEYRHRGRLRQVRAGREVIVSGGAVNSPQLLMLSGIGPAERLAALGLPVVVAETCRPAAALVRRTGCGLIVDSANPEAVATAFEALAADPALRGRMGAAGRRALTADYAWEEDAARLAALHRRLARPREEAPAHPARPASGTRHP